MARPDERFAEAVGLYESGLSIGDLCGVYGNSRQSMWDVLRRRGCVFRTRLRSGPENAFWRGTTADDPAQNKLEKAVLYGRIQRPTACEQCGADYQFKDGRRGIQAHHDDYNRPLEVRWLCQKCHHVWHRDHKAVCKVTECGT
jgi:hypothetical protein